MQHRLIIILFFFFFIFCTSGSKQKTDTKRELDSTVKKIADTTENSKDIVDKKELAERNVNISLVNGAVLENILPQELAGLQKQKSHSQRNKDKATEVSHAKGEYFNENQFSRINLEISDMGTMAAIMQKDDNNWIRSEFEIDDKDRIERTTIIKGHKAFEKIDLNSKKCKIKIFVANRFLVELESSGLSYEKITKSLELINFTELVNLAEDAQIY